MNEQKLETDHSKSFFKFLNILDELEIRYVIMRGFSRFPTSPDTDVDLVYHIDDHEKYVNAATMYLKKLPSWQSFGSGEWCEMLYYPSATRGEEDKNLPNGHFRIDAYNSIYFKTPYTNFSTYWTISKDFNDFVLANRVKNDENFGTYYTPEIECEIALLVARNVLDNKKRPSWNTKHIKRIESVLSRADKTKLIDRIQKLFPNSEKITDLIYEGKFTSIMDYALGIKI